MFHRSINKYVSKFTHKVTILNIQRHLQCGIVSGCPWKSIKSVIPSNARSVSDLYKVLGVSETATQQEIRKAFLKKAMKIHPDINKSPLAQKEFLQVSSAYEVLRDKEKKEKYDELLKSARVQAAGGVRGEEGEAGEKADDLDQFVVSQFNRRKRRAVPRETFADWYSSQFEGLYADLNKAQAEKIEIIEDFDDGKKKYQFRQKKQKVAADEQQIPDDKLPEGLGFVQEWFIKLLRFKIFRRLLLSDRIFCYIYELYHSNAYHQLIHLNLQHSFYNDSTENCDFDDSNSTPTQFSPLSLLNTDLFISRHCSLLETHSGIAIVSDVGRYLGGLVVSRDAITDEKIVSLKFQDDSLIIATARIGYDYNGCKHIRIANSLDQIVYEMHEEYSYKPFYLVDHLMAFFSTNYAVYAIRESQKVLVAHYSISPFSKNFEFVTIDSDRVCHATSHHVNTGLKSYPYSFKWNIKIEEHASLDPIVYFIAISEQNISLRSSIFPYFAKIARSVLYNHLIVGHK